jgi:hypothetical protein
MSQFALIAAVWSLVGAPALCRSGVMTACCSQEPVQVSTPTVAHGCCEECDETPSEAPVGANPTQRECGSCADVCHGSAKPGQLRGLAELSWMSPISASPAMVVPPPVFESEALAIQACHAGELGDSRLASTLPLRI